MSYSRSPRAVRSTTMGTRGMVPSVGLATLPHFAVRALVATTLLALVLPSAASARVVGPAYFGASTGPGAATEVFPIAGDWAWGGPSTHFGDRGGAHKGEDVMAPCGTPLHAVATGTVAHTESDGSAGNTIVVRRPRAGGDHVYMHLDREPGFAVGDRVRGG